MKIVAQIFTFIIMWFVMWLFFALIGYMASPGVEYREILANGGTISATLFLGWIPGVGLCCAIDEEMR